MRNRYIIPLLCAASVAFARGTTGHKQTLAASVDDDVKSAVSATLSVHENQVVEFRLDVRNNTTKMVELSFPSGKTHDFIVQDASGREVWRWSKGRMFTQGLRTKLVKSREVTTFSESWRAEDVQGKLTAIAVLTSDNHPLEERVEFTLK